MWRSSVKARCETTMWKNISNLFTKLLNSKTTRQWVALILSNVAKQFSLSTATNFTRKKKRKVNHSLKFCPISDTQLPNHCSFKWPATDFNSREPQPQNLLERSWSEKTTQQHQKIKRSFNPRSFSCIRIAGNHGPKRNAIETALQELSLQSFWMSETKKELIHFPDPASHNCDVHEKIHFF